MTCPAIFYSRYIFSLCQHVYRFLRDKFRTRRVASLLPNSWKKPLNQKHIPPNFNSKFQIQANFGSQSPLHRFSSLSREQKKGHLNLSAQFSGVSCSYCIICINVNEFDCQYTACMWTAIPSVDR
jgi:galactose mutarotase-like enzyme